MINEIEVVESARRSDEDVLEIHNNLDSVKVQMGKLKQSASLEKNQEHSIMFKRCQWSFFLSSVFISCGICTLTEHPVSIFLGIGLGFLFFVDPICQRILDLIDHTHASSD